PFKLNTRKVFAPAATRGDATSLKIHRHLLVGALRYDHLPVETELVTPVLAPEGPEDVLVVWGHHTVRLRLFLCHATAHHELIELVALGGGDIDEDLGGVAQVFVELVEVSLVAVACQRASVADRQVASEVQRVGDISSER